MAAVRFADRILGLVRCQSTQPCYVYVYIDICITKLIVALQSLCLGHVNVIAVILCVCVATTTCPLRHTHTFFCCASLNYTLFVLSFRNRILHSYPKEAHHIAISWRVFPAVCRQLNTHTFVYMYAYNIWGWFFSSSFFLYFPTYNFCIIWSSMCPVMSGNDDK